MRQTPPPAFLDQLLIPDRPYAKGGLHFSNGATWVEQLAQPLGFADNTRPAFRELGTDATNYAIGGARARNTEANAGFGFQVNAFLNTFGGTAPADALYVIEFGSNDVRDALAAADPTILASALTSIGNNIGALYGAGARKFLVCNAPDISLTPAVLTLDTLFPGAAQSAHVLSMSFNDGLNALLASLAGAPGVEIVRVDFFQKLTDIVAEPTAFDLRVVDTACVMPNTPPYTCQQPDQFIFWDGIHPTQAVHAIISQEAATVLAQ